MQNADLPVFTKCCDYLVCFVLFYAKIHRPILISEEKRELPAIPRRGKSTGRLIFFARSICVVDDFFTRSICAEDSFEDFVPLVLLSPTQLMLGLMCCYSQTCNKEEQKEFEGDSDAIFCTVARVSHRLHALLAA